MHSRRSAPLAMLVGIAFLLSLISSGISTPTARAAASAATCAPNTGTATIGGTVTNNTATPLSNVLVTAFTIYGAQANAAYTNASGVYQITGLIGGSYLLRFQPQSGIYTTEWYSNQPGPLTAAPVTVAEAGASTGNNAQLEAGARLSGQVTGAGSGPLQSASVDVYDSTGQRVAGGTTDASGNYTTSPGLINGNYRVQFRRTSGFLGTYYNGKPSLETADVIAVSAPTVQTGINATLQRGGQITGKVTNAATGLPVSSASVAAYGDGGDDFTYTNATGDFTLDGLGSGSYTVRAQASSTSNLVGAERTVTVTAPNATSGVNFALTQGGTLSGHVTDENGLPLNSIVIYISNADGSYQDYVTTNASGDYSATGLPTGEYEVLFRPTAYIPERYNDRNQDADGDRIAVTAPNTVTGIDAVLARGTAISGKVTDANGGAPIKNVFVEVLDLEGGRVETAFTQADGTYQTPATLASGSYKVRFNADERFASCTYVTEYYNDKRSVETADPVVVTAPTALTNIDAALTRGSIIFGKLTDAATGAPITGGQVTIYDAAGKFAMFGRVTFLGGYQTVTGLPSGSYRIRFSDNGQYIDEFYNDKATLATADPVTISAPTDLTGIDASLALGGIIQGRATAADTGAPFTEGYVAVFDVSGVQVASDNIDDTGNYRVMTGLATGSYKVAVIPYNSLSEASMIGMISTAEPAQATPGGGTPRAYAPTFYGGTITPSGATPVAVSAPTTTNSIDINVLHGAWLPFAPRR